MRLMFGKTLKHQYSLVLCFVLFFIETCRILFILFAWNADSMQFSDNTQTSWTDFVPFSLKLLPLKRKSVNVMCATTLCTPLHLINKKMATWLGPLTQCSSVTEVSVCLASPNSSAISSQFPCLWRRGNPLLTCCLRGGVHNWLGTFIKLIFLSIRWNWAY